MTRFLLRFGMVAALLGAWPTLAQEPVRLPRTTFSLGLSGSAGMPYTEMSPTELDLGGVSSLKIDAKPNPFFNGTPLRHVYAVAVLARGARGNWFVQPEAGFQWIVSTPLSYDDGRRGSGWGLDFTNSTRYHNFNVKQLSMGVLAGRYLEKEHHWYMLTGAAVGLRTGGYKYSYSSSPNELAQEITHSLNQAPEKTRFFLQGGLGYWGLARCIDFELRYVHGITPLVRSLTFRDKEYALKAQGHMLLLSMAFSYDFKRKANANSL